MEQKRLSSLIGLCILVTISQYEVTTQRPDTDGCCLKPVEKYVTDRINYRNVSIEADCEALRRKNESCVDVYWVFNTESHRNECWLKMSEASDTQHWTLFNCADDHLSYCWDVKTGVHQVGGTHQQHVTNEDDCKQICIDNRNCTAVDWNINITSCWILLHKSVSKLKHSRHSISHWIIVRDLPRTFQKTTGNNETVRQSTTETSSSTTLNWTQHVVKALSVLLGVSTVVIAVLMGNAWRIHQKMRNYTCQAQENGYQSYNVAVTQPAAYTDIARALPPIPYESESVYADIDDAIRA